jgi:hypothetical protein
MKGMTTMKRIPPTILLLSALFAACGDEDPGNTGTSVTIGAPGIVSPAEGAQVVGTVTLTVSNATVSGGTGPARYTFQVSTNSSFTDIAAQAQDIPEGSGGQTSWIIGSELAAGEFFWRARATVGATDGPSRMREGSTTEARSALVERAITFCSSIPSPTARVWGIEAAAS